MDKTREVEIRTDLGKSLKARPPLVQFNKFLGWIVASCIELRFRKGGNNKNNTHTHTHTYIYILFGGFHFINLWIQETSHKFEIYYRIVSYVLSLEHHESMKKAHDALLME